MEVVGLVTVLHTLKAKKEGKKTEPTHPCHPSPQTWMAAVSHALYSWSLGIGVLTSLGSYNQYNTDYYRLAFTHQTIPSSFSFLHLVLVALQRLPAADGNSRGHLHLDLFDCVPNHGLFGLQPEHAGV